MVTPFYGGMNGRLFEELVISRLDAYVVLGNFKTRKCTKCA